MSSEFFTRERILELLGRLSELLERDGVQGEILVLGGSAFVLAFNSRLSTKDVHGVFEPKSRIYEAARKVGEECCLRRDGSTTP